MTTNVDKLKELGILKDLLENHTEASLNKMDAEELLCAWLDWEGIIGYGHRIVNIFKTLSTK